MADEMADESIRVLPRWGLRAPKPFSRRQYRSRTGPNCCGPGCASSRKKSKRQALSKRDAAAARG